MIIDTTIHPLPSVQITNSTSLIKKKRVSACEYKVQNLYRTAVEKKKTANFEVLAHTLHVMLNWQPVAIFSWMNLKWKKKIHGWILFSYREMNLHTFSLWKFSWNWSKIFFFVSKGKFKSLFPYKLKDNTCIKRLFSTEFSH